MVGNNDFDSVFDSAVAEVEAGGGESADSVDRTAVIHKGDGEVSDPQAGDGTEEDLFAEDEDEGDDPESDEEDDSEDESDDSEDADTPVEFDLTSHKDELVTVKVNGEEVSVPLGEAIKGYMRQADYTRKTQQTAELQKAAEWGKSMREALLEDPQGVIFALAQSFNVELGADPEEDTFDSDDPEIVKVLKRLKDTEARLAEVTKADEARAYAAVEDATRKELKDVADKYGKDFDPVAAMQLVVQRQGAMSIEEAHLIVAGQKSRSIKADATKVAETATKKRKASSQSSHAVKRNATKAEPTFEGNSFEDRLKFALAQSES